MPLGIAGAVGADAMSQRIRQQMLDRRLASQDQNRNDLANREMALREQQGQHNIAQDQQQAFERQLALGLTAKRERDAAAATSVGNLGVGGDITDQQFGQSFQGTPSEAMVPSLMTLPATRLSPVSGETGTESVPSTEQGIHRSLGTPVQQEKAATKAFLGSLIGRLNPGSPERLAVEYQQGTGDNIPAGLLPKPPGPGQLVRNQRNEYVRVGEDNTQTPTGVNGYVPPKAAAGDGKLTRVEHKDPDTGRTVIEYLPQSALGGQKFEKGVLGATESRLASAEAVTQTGQDMIASLHDPAVASKLGPALGRYNTLKDFIGNPPPEFAKLAGQIESYSLANMGVHGMRSAQGAQMIAKLLDQHHTPESLAATIQGLNDFSNHFMENEGRKVTQSAPKTDASGLPAVGGTFNGAKVLKVEKVQ